MHQDSLIVRHLGFKAWSETSQAMHDFTEQRSAETPDEIWLVQHFPVFTQGQAGKTEHILSPGPIPVMQSDRGGQVTYHGPGQQIAYILLDIRRKKWGVRQLVTALEESVIKTLAHFSITAISRPDAPGVYVDGKKICSLGLRIRRGCSFHGLALNINMDLAPFNNINPCGYAGLQMTQLCDLAPDSHPDNVTRVLVSHLAEQLAIPAERVIRIQSPIPTSE